MQHTVICNPVAKGRPQFNRKTGAAFTPAKTRNYEAWVAMVVKQWFRAPLDGPLSITIDFYLPRPQKISGPRYPNPGPVIHTKTPDLDNLIKAVLDGMNKVVFKDDSQLAQIIGRKWYQAIGAKPCFVFEIQKVF